MRFGGSLFTGKERDEETGYGYFGARYMDYGLLTSWISVDPMANKYPGISPYAYCAWNPMKLVDPDGREIDNWIINVATGEKTVEPSDNNSVTIVGNGVHSTYNFPDGDFYLNVEQSSVDGESNCTISAYGGTKYDNASLFLNYTTNENSPSLKSPRTIDGIVIPDYFSFTAPQGYGAGISGTFCGIIGLSFSIGIARDGLGEWGGFFSLNFATGVEVGIGINGFAIEPGKGIESIGGENQIVSVSAMAISYSRNYMSSTNNWGMSLGYKAGLSSQLGWTWTF